METLLSIAVALCAGLLVSRFVKPLKLPAVTGYLIAGILIGPYCLGRLGVQGLGFPTTGDGTIHSIERWDATHREVHLRHLESNHPGHFQRLLLTGALNAYLHTVDEQASERFDVLTKGYAQSWGITEALKAEDPMKWVGLINLARAEAEHNVMTEIICA